MGARPAHFDGDALGFVDVAAEEMSGLAALDEVANGGGSGVQSGLDQIERGAVGWGVADEDQRVEIGEGGEPFGDLRLAVFAGGMEGCRAGVPESGDVPGAGGEVALVEIVEAVLVAERGDLGGGFVVAGEYPDLVAARRSEERRVGKEG